MEKIQQELSKTHPNYGVVSLCLKQAKKEGVFDEAFKRFSETFPEHVGNTIMCSYDPPKKGTKSFQNELFPQFTMTYIPTKDTGKDGHTIHRLSCADNGTEVFPSLLSDQDWEDWKQYQVSQTV
jgi:hypothetical protein